MLSDLLNPLLKSLVACMLLSGVGLGARAQSLPVAEAHFPAEADSVVVPFSIWHGFLIIAVELEGVRPLRMVVDTGAPIMAVTDTSLARDLTYQVIGQAQVDGTGSETMRTAPLVSGLTPRVGGIALEGGLALIDGGMHGLLLGLDGIIGASLFEDAIVKIDPVRQRLVLYRPEAYAYEGEGSVLPLVRQPNGHVQTSGEVVLDGQTLETPRMLVDTGALQPLSLYLDGDEDLALPDSMLHDIVIAWGSRGPERGDVLRLDALRLGDQTLPCMITTVRQSSTEWIVDAVLGLDALLRFETVFDYSGGRLILDPTAETELPFDYSTTGITVAPPVEGTHLTIRDVLAASPAADAGLQEGDRIIAVDGTTVQELLAQGNVRGFLQIAPGARLHLTIVRGTNEMTVTVQPRRLI